MRWARQALAGSFGYNEARSRELRQIPSDRRTPRPPAPARHAATRGGTRRAPACAPQSQDKQAAVPDTGRSDAPPSLPGWRGPSRRLRNPRPPARSRSPRRSPLARTWRASSVRGAGAQYTVEAFRPEVSANIRSTVHHRSRSLWTRAPRYVGGAAVRVRSGLASAPQCGRNCEIAVFGPPKGCERSRLFRA